MPAQCKGAAGVVAHSFPSNRRRPALHLYNLSRDGRVAAVTRTIAGSANVWLLDTERGVPRRLTFDVNDNDVILSPDGTRVAHQANGPRDGSVVDERHADGTGGEIQLLEESVDEWHSPQDWSADGRYIVYMVTTTTGLDLRALPSLANVCRSTSHGHRLRNSAPECRQTAAGRLRIE
jgi:hypothetical protein